MKNEKKVINILIVFFISYKSDIKTFLKWILNQCRTALVNMTLGAKLSRRCELLGKISLLSLE